MPAEFHVREDGMLVFPARRPQGDQDVPRLEMALRGMLSSWQDRLEENKPSFPMNNSLWGLVQLIVYDMWCTIEETRIYDIAFVESLRMTHYYSPLLTRMLNLIRTRIAQSFGAVLAMSRRLEIEMQRVHTKWSEMGDALHREGSLRKANEQQIEQLQAKVALLESRSRSQGHETSHKSDEKRTGAHIPELLLISVDADSELASASRAVLPSRCECSVR